VRIASAEEISNPYKGAKAKRGLAAEANLALALSKKRIKDGPFRQA
jgi:hypothetical protein